MKRTIFNNRKKTAKAYSQLHYIVFWLVFGSAILVILAESIPFCPRIFGSIILLVLAVLELLHAMAIEKQGSKSIPEQYPDGVLPKWKPHNWKK
jgi:4-hydroxybenzoate polyprenyltransferase